MQITILRKRGKSTEKVSMTVEKDWTVDKLKRTWAHTYRTNYHRQAFKMENDKDPKKPVRLQDPEKTLGEYGVAESSELVFRDIGPQIGYRTVFLVEYFGPILMMAICLLRPSLLYGEPARPLSRQAELAAWAFIAHFVKRELETLFVHRFSRPTMPLANLFKNSVYYWSFAFFVSYVLCHPEYTDADPAHFQIGMAAMAVAEVVNFAVHVQFRMMRPKEGSLKRDPPKGALFALVSCPNYTAEVLSWVFFSLATNVFMSYAFTFVGFLQMTEWALSKHRGYLRTYPEYKRFGRKAIIPFIL